MSASLAATPVHPPVAVERPGRSRFVAIAVAVVVIWLAVLFSSLYAPALVAGSEHETIAIASVADWLWGALATAFLLLAASFSRPGGSGPWWVVAAITAIVWIAVALTSVYAPSLVTGSDPTTVPVAGLVAPIVGVLVTGYLAVFAAGMSAPRSA